MTENSGPMDDDAARLRDELAALFEGLQAAAADGLAALFADIETRAEAELAARGIRPVCVVHGDPAGPEDADMISGLHILAAQCGTMAGYRGGHAYTTFLFAGPAAQAAAAAFAAAVRDLAPRSWRVTASAYPARPA